MITPDVFRRQALSFPEAEEAAHFDKASFRVRKKIFATYNAPEARVCLKLSEVDQSVYTAAAPGVIYPVPNKWGKQGWTLVLLKRSACRPAARSACKSLLPRGASEACRAGADILTLLSCLNPTA